MLYRFKSAATGDHVMVAAHGEALLAILGKAAAPQGIVTVAELPGAICALDAAMNADHAAVEGDADADEPEAVSLRRRAWPLLTMLKDALAAQVPVVWGV